MKIVKLLTAILLAVNFLTLSLSAKSIPCDDAKNVAVNWIYSITGQQVSVDDSIQDSSAVDKELYIIRLKPKGWVIVLGDDSVEPVLAYSSESSLGTVDSLPFGFVAWMDNADKQIKEAKNSNTQSDTALEEKWKKLTVYPEDFRLAMESGDGIDRTSYQSNAGYVQDIILDISTESESLSTDGTLGSISPTTTTVSGGKVVDGWYSVDVALDSSSVDYSEGLVSDGYVRPRYVRPRYEPPSTPTGISASDGTYTFGVIISNYSVSGATSYKIYRNGIYKARTIGIRILDMSAKPGKYYNYSVRASNSYGDSGMSAPDKGWRASAKPAKPITIKASDGTFSSGVVINNYYVYGASHYKIYRAKSSRGPKAYLDLTYSASYKDKTAWPDYKYYYYVKACKGNECSYYSDYDIGWRNDGIPATPTTITASDGNFVSNVSIGSYGVSGATYYKIYRAKSFNDYISYLGLTYGVGYQDTIAWPGYKYYYFVKACNDKGCSNYSEYNMGWRKQ